MPLALDKRTNGPRTSQANPTVPKPARAPAAALRVEAAAPRAGAAGRRWVAGFVLGGGYLVAGPPAFGPRGGGLRRQVRVLGCVDRGSRGGVGVDGDDFGGGGWRGGAGEGEGCVGV